MDTNYANIDVEQELDLKDMLVAIMMKWKLLLCCILAGMIVTVAVGLVKARKSQSSGGVSTDEQIAAVRESLSETEATEVDRVFAQYQTYQSFITNQEQFSSSLESAKKNNKKMKVVKYYIVSSMKNIGSLFSSMAVSSEDYEKIAHIIGNDDEKTAGSSIKSEMPVQFYSNSSMDNSNYIADNDRNNMSKEATLITAFIFADTESQCDAIQDIVDQAFEQERIILSEVDSGIICRQVDALYSLDIRDYTLNVQRNIIDRLNLANNALNAINSSSINSFTQNQKEYFNLLKTQSFETNDVKSSTTNKEATSFGTRIIVKYAILGALFGCFISVCWVLFRYIVDDHIKTDSELAYYGLPVIGTILFQEEDNRMSCLARKITGIYPTDKSLQEHMLAEDISIMIGEGQRLYYLLSSEQEEDKEVAERINRLISTEELSAKKNIETHIGSLFNEPSELKVLSEADSVIISVHLKKTRRETLKRAVEVCGRYGKSIKGTIVIGVC